MGTAAALDHDTLAADQQLTDSALLLGYSTSSICCMRCALTALRALIWYSECTNGRVRALLYQQYPRLLLASTPCTALRCAANCVRISLCVCCSCAAVATAAQS
jgi:hypothetical protein